MNLQHINYSDLNSRQQERYNFQKIAGLLADYGFSCIKLDDDWQGADFLAQHIDGFTYLKVQLKGRLTFDKKYIAKNIFVAFPHLTDWYLFNHDELLKIFSAAFIDGFTSTSSWINTGCYSWPSLSPKSLALLEPYKLTAKQHIIPG